MSASRPPSPPAFSSRPPWPPSAAGATSPFEKKVAPSSNAHDSDCGSPLKSSPHMTSRLIVVDKDAKYAEWLRNHLGVLYSDANVRVMTPEQFELERESLTYDECDLVLLTASYGEHPEDPRAEGILLLRSFRGRSNFPAVLAIAEDGNELTAVRALQLG